MAYMYKKTDSNFDIVHWVTGLSDRKSLRFHLSHLMAKEGKLVATDGSELREITIDLPDGYYIVLSRAKSKVEIIMDEPLENGSWPEYKKLIPNIEDDEDYVSVDINHACIDKGLSDVIRKTNAHGFDPVRYIKLFESMDIFYTVHVDKNGCKPLYTVAENKAMAMLMPIRT